MGLKYTSIQSTHLFAGDSHCLFGSFRDLLTIRKCKNETSRQVFSVGIVSFSMFKANSLKSGGPEGEKSRSLTGSTSSCQTKMKLRDLRF